MNMARYEQETIISFNEEEKTAGIYTHNKILRQKLAALARDRPEDCRLVKVSHSGRAVDYTIPKSWIRSYRLGPQVKRKKQLLQGLGKRQVSRYDPCARSVSTTPVSCQG